MDFAGGDVLTYLRVDRIQHLMPASDGLDNFVGIGGPDEGLWLLVVVGDEALIPQRHYSAPPSADPAASVRRPAATQGSPLVRFAATPLILRRLTFQGRYSPFERFHWCGSSWHKSGAYDWLLDDRQVDDCREHAEQNSEPPNDIIRAGALEEEPAEPHPKKTADLMAEERKAK